MPYPRAHYYVLALAAVIAAGFWESYFSVWGSVPWQFHAHALTASIWVLMVAAQSWSAHHEQLAFHRVVGTASLLLFPFLIGGLAAIIDVTAKAYIAGDKPVQAMLGGSFLIGLVVAVAAYVTLYFRALEHRRQVWRHSGYMLTTAIILFESPFGRILGSFVPGLTINGPADFDRIIPTILCSMAVELVIIAMIWARYRGRAKPFLVGAVFILAQMLGMGLMTESVMLKSLLALVGELPSGAVVLAGVLIGGLTSWAGWKAGRGNRIARTGFLETCAYAAAVTPREGHRSD
jgi:hypothetical protein